VRLPTGDKGMAMDDEEDKKIYDVVMNQEEQYSIWAKGREIPRGWRAVGKEGSKRECLEHIDQVWVDMRPLSLRKKMESMANEGNGE
jgi:MbtH protein